MFNYLAAGAGAAAFLSALAAFLSAFAGLAASALAGAAGAGASAAIVKLANANDTANTNAFMLYFPYVKIRTNVYKRTQYRLILCHHTYDITWH